MASELSATALPGPSLKQRLARAERFNRLKSKALILPLFEEPQVYGLTAAVQGFATESVGRPRFYDTWLTD